MMVMRCQMPTAPQTVPPAMVFSNIGGAMPPLPIPTYDLHQQTGLLHHQYVNQQYCTCPQCTTMYGSDSPSYYSEPQGPVPPTPLLPPPTATLGEAMMYSVDAATPQTNCQCEACLMSMSHSSSQSAATQGFGGYSYHALPQHDSTSMQIPSEMLVPHNSFNDRRVYNGQQQLQPQQQQQQQLNAQHNGVQPISQEHFDSMVGKMFEAARSSNGSSFLQASMRDGDAARFSTIYSELYPHFGELLLDSHGCYVMRTLMEQMSTEQMEDVLSMIAADEQLTFSLCTHSLHTRRVVQFFLDSLLPEQCQFIVDLMITRCGEVAKTQQGCIAMQRVMDVTNAAQKDSLFSTIEKNILEFSMDPFANYVVQYILEMGDKERVSQRVLEQFGSHMNVLACNKFASNVVEKVLHHTTAEAQHELVEELYSVEADRLEAILQDSFGNYIVQATIALCSFKDVWMISERLRPILHTTPYGYKIAARLERRLKGKPLTNTKAMQSKSVLQQ